MGNSYKTKTKHSYYKILNKFLRSHQDEYYYNINNINFSLLTKTFCSSHNQEPNLILESENINWFTYLKRKLLFLSNNYNYIWANNLYLFISNNKFKNQYKYLSIFFFEEFQLLTLPSLSNFQPILHYSSQNSNIFKRKGKNKIYEINNDSSGDEDNAEFDNRSTNIKNINDYKEIINNLNKKEIKIPNDVLGSLASISLEEINSFLIENEPTKAYQLGKAKIKKYIDIFRMHLCHKDHPINIILNKFNQEFNPIIVKAISSCKNLENDIESIKKCEDIIHQLQDFMITLQIAIKLFYSKCISYDAFGDEKDEFLNLISFLVFNTGNIYKNIYEIIQIINYKKIKDFEKQLDKFGEIIPEDIGVSDIFCLNETTKEYMNKYKNKKINILNKKSKDKLTILNTEKMIENTNNKDFDNNNNKKQNNEFENKHYDVNKNNENFNNSIEYMNISSNTMPKAKKINIFFDNFYEYDNNNDSNRNEIENNIINTNITNTININNEEQKSNGNLTLNLIISEEVNYNKKNQFLLNFGRTYSSINYFKENKNDEPYYEAIKILKSIIKCKTPLEKLIIMASLSSFITDSIYKFWKPIEELINPTFLNIEADELMKILIYIVYKSKMTKLFVHLDFIKYFSIKESLTTMIGYYYTLLEGALNFILEAKNKNELLRN